MTIEFVTKEDLDVAVASLNLRIDNISTGDGSVDLAPILTRLDAIDQEIIALREAQGVAWTHEDITSKLKFRFKTQDDAVFIGTGSSAVYSAGLHRLGNMQFIDLYVGFGDKMWTDVYQPGARLAGARNWGWVFVPTEDRLRPMVGGLGSLEIYRNLANEGRGLGWSAWNRFGAADEWGLFPFWVDVGFTNANLSYDWPAISDGWAKTLGSHFRLVTHLYQARA
jgi:hypothetical protein